MAVYLTVVLAVQAVFALVSPFVNDQAHQYSEWHRAWNALQDGRESEASRIYNHANEGFNAWSILGLLGTLSLVFLIIWMWRSAHNARALGRTGARLSPGWAIAAWFIPLASYVLLYLLYSDLWRSSDPDAPRGDGWRSQPGSSLIRTFWFLHVAASITTFGTVGYVVFNGASESTARTLLVVSAALTAAGLLLNILVVREITARQEALQARDPAPTSMPVSRTFAAPTTVDGPGWYPDPGRRYDHRYWDGRGWTEHVSQGGVVSTAPVVPADWYPDPTGRFHWRYWTGHEWTEHVSRDEQLFLDPLRGDDPAPGAPQSP
jgi:hypothetical protein